MEALRRVFDQDVGRKLLTQDIGTLRRDIDQLRGAGAFLDNTRVQGMIGFISNPVSSDQADVTVGGGPVAATQTELTLTRSQKALIQAKTQALFLDGLRLQQRLLELSRRWQEDVAQIARAQWDLKLASFMRQNAGTEALRRQAGVLAADASDRLHQALLDYNALSGRSPDAPVPFKDLSASDLRELTAAIRGTLSGGDRLKAILHELDPAQMKERLGPEAFNLLDWLPFLDRMTLSIGAQLQDSLANQAMTVGVSLRIPVYDPSSGHADKAYRLESRATIAQMAELQAERRLEADRQDAQARLSAGQAKAAQAGLPRAARALSLAIRAYRNGLIGEAELQQAFDTWRWYAREALDGEIESSLSAAWAASGRYLAGSTDDGNGDGSGNENGSLALGSLDEAFSQAESRSGSLAEVALREQAAAEMARDNAHRIQKVLLDLNIGTGLTASGDGWLPAVGLTGYPVMPIVRFEFKPEELRELQAEEGRGQTEYYRQLKAELEGELALELYQSVVAYQSASAAVSRYDDSLLPGLRERAEVEGQGSGGAAVKAQRRLDAALEKRAQAALARRQALATLNFLLGRRGDAPLQVGIDADQALAWLRAALSRENPVAARQRLLKARVQTAQAVETVVDKDLRAQQLALEPVSLVARSLGRLIDVLGGGKPGRPQLLAEARAQTLREQRALDAYPGQRRAAIAQAKAQLNLVRSRLESLSNGGDAAQRELLLGRERILLGALCALGADGQDAAPQSYSELPHSFDELGERLAQARQDMSARQPGSPVELLAPATQRQRPAGFARYYYAQQTLGKVAIDKSYVEGWLETRLRDYETDPKVLLRLAQLSGRKADELHRVEVAGSRAQGEMLAADFEAEARLLRWAETARGQEGADLRASLLKELEARRAEIVALLNLPPDTGLDSLLALVPAQSRGDGDPSALASGFSGQIRRLGLGELERSLFADGQLAGLGTDADLLSRLRAGLLAERMSYDGLTPVLAFGLFRGTPTGGAVLEVPDPRQIEHGLDNMLSEALRKDLESSGRLRELSLGLRALMAKVQDEEVEVERSARLVQAAEADYRAQLGLVGEGGDLAEAEAARSRLLKAWLGFSRRLSGARADFVELVTELEALNPGRRAGLRPLVHPLRAQPPTLRSDPRRRLLSYWTDRMLDADFRADLSRRLDLIAARASPAQGKALSQLRRRLEEDAGLYSTADRDAAAVLAKDFSDAERLDLLSRNDREGKREALSFDLGRLLEACGGLSQRDDPLVAFLVRDIDAQARRAAAARDDFAALDGALRQAAWSADDPARGIFQRLEAARQTMETARQALWADDDGLEENATRVLLKDSRLDDFLKAQQRYDAEVVGTFQSEAVRRDRSLAWRLDAFFDLDAALDRQIDAARGGRGMLAMDALIALERSRLLAARWEGRPPGELDALAANLQALRDRRQAWRSGASDVEPLYAVTRIERDGRRLWSVEGWMTRREFEAERAAGRVKSVDGRMIWSGGAAPRELIGGIDAARADLDSARSAARDNGAVLSRQGLLERYDYVPDRPLRGDRAPAREGLSVEDLFGAAGLGRQGRLLFFKAPKPGEPAGSEHQALDPIAALSLSPDDYVVYAYDGGKPLDKGAFPSLESLKDSERRSDFARLTLSPSGARDLGARLERQRQAELEAGWVDVKLDGYGFARDAKGDVVQIYLTRDDFRAQRKAFANAARDLEALRAASRRAQEREQRAKGELEARRAALEHARPAYEAARARRSSDKAGFDSAQAAFDALSKASSRAQADYEAANAAAQNARRAVTEEKSTLARSKAWSLYRSRDLSLSLDADGTIVAAAAQPVYGAQTLSQPVASGGPVARVLSGELLAAALDSQGRLVGYYQDPEALAADARRWKLVTVSLGAGSELPAAARTVDPRARLDHYELPLPGGGSAPIALNRRYLIAQVQDARAKLHAADHYAVLPWHWGDLLLELPRGVAGAPLELLGGRDPRQQHYLGRAAMYRTEGGSTERQGFFRRAAGLIDILDFLPDPVERFFDPSQFPDHVAVDSPLLPGQSVFDKGMRTLDGRKDIHFGATALRRELSYSLEDLAAEQRRALEHFHGGEETLLVSSWRGRSGLYQDSTRSGAAGPQALRSALNEPSFSAELPDSLAVEGLRRVVRPRLGADELAQEEAALKGYPEAFLRRLGLRRSRQAGLEQRSARAQATLKRAQAARRGAHARAEALWSR
ncbi:MAG: TolC family protein, partial [Elusimicrobia bacterium]|nr:TolC family protein [Elusimicrobiota bacterium]